jgi:hypothetical protein
MRLVAMNERTAILAGSRFDEFQWRYDELNNELLCQIASGGLNASTAWSIINFLTPDPAAGRFPKFHNSAAIPWQTVEVDGSVSLCELRSRTMKSLFGHYGDAPVTITLPRYCF